MRVHTCAPRMGSAPEHQMLLCILRQSLCLSGWSPNEGSAFSSPEITLSLPSKWSEQTRRPDSKSASLSPVHIPALPTHVPLHPKLQAFSFPELGMQLNLSQGATAQHSFSFGKSHFKLFVFILINSCLRVSAVPWEARRGRQIGATGT